MCLTIAFQKDRSRNVGAVGGSSLIQQLVATAQCNVKSQVLERRKCKGTSRATAVNRKQVVMAKQ